MPIAIRATAAVINTATSCGSRRLSRRCNGHTSAMINKAKATGVITLCANDKAASVNITAQITAENRKVRSLVGRGELSGSTDEAVQVGALGPRHQSGGE